MPLCAAQVCDFIASCVRRLHNPHSHKDLMQQALAFLQTSASSTTWTDTTALATFEKFIQDLITFALSFNPIQYPKPLPTPRSLVPDFQPQDNPAMGGLPSNRNVDVTHAIAPQLTANEVGRDWPGESHATGPAHVGGTPADFGPQKEGSAGAQTGVGSASRNPLLEALLDYSRFHDVGIVERSPAGDAQPPPTGTSAGDISACYCPLSRAMASLYK
jgi:hypothetical protein